MNNNRTMWQMNLDRHYELLHVAHDQRLIKKQEAKGIKARDSVLPNIGDVFTSLRFRLKARYQSITQ